MKGLFVLSFLALASCGGSSGGSGSTPAAPLEGLDLSGTYRFANVQCYSSSGSFTAAAEPDLSSPTDNISITGNTYNAKTTGSSCIADYKGKIVFTPTDDVSGSLDLTNRTSTTSTGSTCTFTTTLTPASGGTITPGSITETVNHNVSLPDLNGALYVRNSSDGTLAIFSSFQVSGSPSDLCFMVYLKL